MGFLSQKEKENRGSYSYVRFVIICFVFVLYNATNLTLNISLTLSASSMNYFTKNSLLDNLKNVLVRGREGGFTRSVIGYFYSL